MKLNAYACVFSFVRFSSHRYLSHGGKRWECISVLAKFIFLSSLVQIYDCLLTLMWINIFINDIRTILNESNSVCQFTFFMRINSGCITLHYKV